MCPSPPLPWLSSLMPTGVGDITPKIPAKEAAGGASGVTRNSDAGAAWGPRLPPFEGPAWFRVSPESRWPRSAPWALGGPHTLASHTQLSPSHPLDPWFILRMLTPIPKPRQQGGCGARVLEG